MIVGETCTPSGNWSTHPANRHAFDQLPAEAAHKENFTARDHAVQMMPSGNRAVVSAPEYTTDHLWFLAGTERAQAALEGTRLASIDRTVPTLRGLGL